MRTEIADNPVGLVLYLLALVVGAALIFWVRASRRTHDSPAR
jgi:hypothetical protein